ncbi:MAG: hypothetical protein ACREVE_15905 [Gammaproteobacteria bacterium]
MSEIAIRARESPTPEHSGEQTVQAGRRTPPCTERVAHERVDRAQNDDASIPASSSGRRRETLDLTARNLAAARLNDVYLKAAVLAAIVFAGAHSDGPTAEIATASEQGKITISRELSVATDSNAHDASREKK